MRSAPTTSLGSSMTGAALTRRSCQGLDDCLNGVASPVTVMSCH
jgi:hypothetical protein